MSDRKRLISKILSAEPSGFEPLALEIYAYQYNNNSLYRRFCDVLGKTPDTISNAYDIPCIPVGFFRNHLVSSNQASPEVIFESSSTTGQIPARSPLYDTAFYKTVASRGFEYVMGNPVSDFEWLALLPSYVERPNASLMYMVDHFISLGGGAFFSNNHQEFIARIKRNSENGIKTAVIGVSFALLDLAERFSLDLSDMLVIETGGMKGRREEITRHDLHSKLKEAFNIDSVASEYGMTELTSQAWSAAGGRYRCGATLKVIIRELNDPLTWAGDDQRGAVNCIDLANIDTCSFIATDDIGVASSDGTFEILGRLDGSEQRGCNLLVSDL